MAPQSVLFFERSKFMWDGASYDSRPTAETKKSEYEAQGFEARLVEEDDKAFLYTRRVVKEIVIEGEAPPG